MSISNMNKVIPETLKTLRDGWQYRLDTVLKADPKTSVDFQEIRLTEKAIERVSKLIVELGG